MSVVNKSIGGETSLVAGRHFASNLVGQIDLEKKSNDRQNYYKIKNWLNEWKKKKLIELNLLTGHPFKKRFRYASESNGSIVNWKYIENGSGLFWNN